MDKVIIMCIDDEPQILDSLRRDLTPRYGDNYDIDVCESAEEALEVREEILSEGRKIGIYVVDQRMPGMKGIDFLKQLEKKAGKILLTAYADTEVAIEGINNKCIDFYIRKPYDEVLFEKIDYLMSAFDKGYFVVKARTEEERKEALYLQDTVFSEDYLDLSYERGKNIMKENPYAETTEMFVAVKDKEIIGTTSLNRINRDYAKKLETILGLPIEDHYNIKNVKDVDENLVQIRNAAIKPEYQNMRIGPMIWKEIFKELMTKQPVSPKYAMIISGSRTKDARKAMVILEKAKRLGIYDYEHEIQLRHESKRTEEPISDEEIEDTPLPRLLKLYSKMGFNLIGEPYFLESYDDYAYPMWIESNNIKEPFKSYFLND